MESIIKGIVLIIALFLIYTPPIISEQLSSEVESLKRQIEQIQIENQKMIEEIQQKSQQQIDELKKKIEQMEADRQTDKEEVKELKAESKQTEGKLEEVINSKIEPLTGYFPKVKFNPDFPSYFRSRARLIKNATFLGATPNTEDQIAFADSRLMISPMLEVTENISLRSQIDVARNIIWGGIGDENSADKVFVAPSPSDSFRGAVLRDVTDTFSGNTINAKNDESELEGTGLGLSVVYAIIERHEGKIEVNTEVGKGTTFRIRIPNIQRIANGATSNLINVEPRNINLNPKRKANVLVVDDDISVRNVLKEYLTLIGHNVVIINNGNDISEILKTNHFDIVFLNYTMSGKNGLDVLKEIKTYNESIMVVMITGKAPEEIRDDVMAEGAYSFINKPFTINQIHNTVARILGTEVN